MNQYGRIVEEEWFKSQAMRQEVALDEFVVMPDHFHGIVQLLTEEEEPRACEANVGSANLLGKILRRAPRSLGSLMAGFKSATTKRINVLRGTPGTAVWQSNYYEHVIRNQRELDAIRIYVARNP